MTDIAEVPTVAGHGCGDVGQREVVLRGEIGADFIVGGDPESGGFDVPPEMLHAGLPAFDVGLECPVVGG